MTSTPITASAVHGISVIDDLPYEIYRLISKNIISTDAIRLQPKDSEHYKIVLERRKCANISFKWTLGILLYNRDLCFPNVAINSLLISPNFHDAAAPILYAKFCITLDLVQAFQHRFLTKIGPLNRALIRELEIKVFAKTIDYGVSERIRMYMEFGDNILERHYLSVNVLRFLCSPSTRLDLEKLTVSFEEAEMCGEIVQGRGSLLPMEDHFLQWAMDALIAEMEIIRAAVPNLSLLSFDDTKGCVTIEAPDKEKGARNTAKTWKKQVRFHSLRGDSRLFSDVYVVGSSFARLEEHHTKSTRDRPLCRAECLVLSVKSWAGGG